VRSGAIRQDHNEGRPTLRAGLRDQTPAAKAFVIRVRRQDCQRFAPEHLGELAYRQITQLVERIFGPHQVMQTRVRTT
jgi:hypothetical protein